MKKLIFTTSVFLLTSSLSFAFDPITSAENEKLMKGESIQYVQWKEGYVWPQVSMRVLLDHKPEENMTEFTKFETHKNYIPDVLESKIVKTISPENFHVYLAMEIPWPVKKSEQVTNNVLTKGTDGALTLTWNLVKGEFVKATNGHVTFKPYNGKTLMEYETFIVPNSSFAGMFKDRVATDVGKTVKEISKHLNKTIEKKARSISSL
jgi:hypothetical protein